LILVVDDTKDACDPLKRLLEMTGFPATCAYSGEAALDCMRATTPSLVIMDYMMGVKNGLDVFREMKADPFLRGVPVLFFSAVSDAATQHEAKTMGALDWLVKGSQGWTDILGQVEAAVGQPL
jgi:DNA-binding response OmpR family regulator